MKLENLQNVTVNLDSETAKSIADQYIQFRYAEQFIFMIVILAFFTLIFFCVKWLLQII